MLSPLAAVAGLVVVPLGASTPGSGRAGDLTAVTVTLDGAAAPTGSPIALSATDCWHTLPAAGIVYAQIRAGC